MYREIKEGQFKLSKECPVCGSMSYQDFDRLGQTLVVCPTCGRYRFGPTAELFLSDQRSKGANLKYMISYYLRTVSERAYGFRDNSLYPVYTHEDFEKMAEAREPSVHEKLQILLKFVSRISVHPGYKVLFDAKFDYSVLCAKNVPEVEFYQQSLIDQGYFLAEQTVDKSLLCKISANGWRVLEEMNQSGAESSFGFVAMWFDHSQDEARDSIECAVKKAGYTPIRIDEVEHVNKIDDEIISRIRQSKFLVADFTGHRAGVYFEAGYMLGLGRTVIWLCHESDSDKIHFDARQYNTIIYRDHQELTSKLQFRIEAILGRGPHNEK